MFIAINLFTDIENKETEFRILDMKGGSNENK